MKYLIINADDFGYSSVFNEVILELIAEGLVSATSVMVDWITPEQESQVQQLKELAKSNNVSIGLHTDFKSTSFDQEIFRQEECFKRIFEFSPEHIDLHKSTYLEEGYPHIIKFSQERQIPCKNLGVKPFTKFMTKEKIFDGTKKTLEEIRKWLSSVEDEEYYTIIFHPGKFDPKSKSSLNKERETDAQNIRKLNQQLRELNTKLVSYGDFTSSSKRKKDE